MREIALHILDIAQNSVVAKAETVRIDVLEDTKADTLTVSIVDDGCGMSPEFLSQVTDPFTTKRTSRKVGLGIPLIKLAAENTGGSFEIQSELGKGTSLKAVFGLTHIDRQPLGNMAETILGLVTGNEDVNFVYTHRIDEKEFVLDTKQLKEVLGDVPFSNLEVYSWLSEYLSEGEGELV